MYIGSPDVLDGRSLARPCLPPFPLLGVVVLGFRTWPEVLPPVPGGHHLSGPPQGHQPIQRLWILAPWSAVLSGAPS